MNIAEHLWKSTKINENQYFEQPVEMHLDHVSLLQARFAHEEWLLLDTWPPYTQWALVRQDQWTNQAGQSALSNQQQYL